MSSPNIPLLERLLRNAAVIFRGTPYQKEDIDMTLEKAICDALQPMFDERRHWEWWRRDEVILELMNQLRLEATEVDNDRQYLDQLNQLVHAASRRLAIRIPEYHETNCYRSAERYWEYQEAEDYDRKNAF